MMNCLKMRLVCLVFVLGYAECDRILAVLPYAGSSHFFTFEPVLTELAKRGHDLTVVSHFPKRTPQVNYTDIVLTGKMAQDIMLPLSEIVNIDMSVSYAMSELSNIEKGFESIYQNREVQALLDSQFDLLITELFMSDMFIPLADKFRAPLVMLSSSEVLAHGVDRIGLPDNPSYIPHFFNNHLTTIPMNFKDRFWNAIDVIHTKLAYNYLFTTFDEEVGKRYLGDVASVSEMMNRVSLVLANTHFSVNVVRPQPPQVVEIGGIHIKPTKPLPQDIKKFLDESEHGVVYFSLGSIANGSSMSDSSRKAFCNVFSKLPQRVLWKWEVDDMPEKPANVMLVKWAPQRDVLAHPNVKLFISHGGLLGTMEAVHCGVPILGIPLFGDQRHNILQLQSVGFALKLDLANINEEVVSSAVNVMLNDPKYQNKAKELSSIFRDRPLSPLDTAVYWTEYVMKHKGAHHLRSAAVGMPWYQYFLLDVIGVLLLGVVAVIGLIIYTVKLVCSQLFTKTKTKVH